jgi:quinol monooxygenase YgiN
MTRQVIRYQTKPEATKRNTELIQNVFRELAAAAPGKVHYAVLQSGDSFTHVVAYENEGDNDALTALPAFKAFQDGGADRRLTPPDFADATIVGNYQMLVE